jgi:hypothetical protein
MNRKEADRTIVREGYPSEEGMHILWSDEAGWPVISIVWVSVRDGKPTFWKGSGGTDRTFEVPRLFGMWYDSYLGHSRVTPEALRYYEEQLMRTSVAVNEMLRGEGA